MTDCQKRQGNSRDWRLMEGSYLTLVRLLRGRKPKLVGGKREPRLVRRKVLRLMGGRELRLVAGSERSKFEWR